MTILKHNTNKNMNYRYDEIQSHHYVLSFDPSDKTERGLTREKAQQLGLEFARKNFIRSICYHLPHRKSHRKNIGHNVGGRRISMR